MQDLTNKITHGDCLEVMKNIHDKSIDMVCCDLPYGTTACKWDTIIPFEPLWEQYKRIIKDNGAIVLFGSEPFSSYLRMSNIKNYKYDWVWHKDRPTGFVFANKRPMKIHENILIFYKNQPTYNPQKWQGRPNNAKTKGNNITNIMSKPNGSQPSIKQINVDLSGNKFPISIIYKKKGGSNTFIHPTQKPVALFEYLIKTYTNEGDLVLDNCSGSGTTAIACLGTNRKYICIEKDEVYYQKSLERVEEHNKQLKLF